MKTSSLFPMPHESVVFVPPHVRRIRPQRPNPWVCVLVVLVLGLQVSSSEWMQEQLVVFEQSLPMSWNVPTRSHSAPHETFATSMDTHDSKALTP